MEKSKLNTLKAALFFIVGIISISTVLAQDNNDDKALFSGIVFSSEALTSPLGQVNIVVNSVRGYK